MKHVAAYMLAVLGGNASPSAADLKAILSSVNASADDGSLNKVISELSGKNLDDLMKEGGAKMATMAAAAPAGAAPAAAAAAAPAAGGAAAAPAAKAKAPEPEEDEDMGFSLFD